MNSQWVRDNWGGTCPLGITDAELKANMSPPQLVAFHKWMYGQTLGVCQGKLYNHDTKEYEPACGGVAHGAAYYPWDIARFLNGQAVID